MGLKEELLSLDPELVERTVDAVIAKAGAPGAGWEKRAGQYPSTDALLATFHARLGETELSEEEIKKAEMGLTIGVLVIIECAETIALEKQINGDPTEQ